MKTKSVANKNVSTNKTREELKTELPVSEKDEVKQAEKRTAKAAEHSAKN